MARVIIAFSADADTGAVLAGLACEAAPVPSRSPPGPWRRVGQRGGEGGLSTATLKHLEKMGEGTPVIFDIVRKKPYMYSARKVERLPTHLVRQVTNRPVFPHREDMELAKRSEIASGSGD